MSPVAFGELSTLGKVLEVSKYVGIIGAAGTVVFGAIRWFASAVKRIVRIGINLDTVISNHLPHLQDGVNEIKSEVGQLGTQIKIHDERLEDIKESTDKLHSAFLRHLENGDRELARNRKKK